jgi:hypothetical protein
LRFSVIENSLMSKSQFLGVGLNTLLNGTRVQVTSSGVKPSFWATAAATAPSYPLPFSGLSSTNHGGNTGLSVAIVSLPGVWVCSASLAHASVVADALSLVVAEADVLVEAEVLSLVGEQADTRAAAARSARRGRMARLFKAAP